MKAWIRQPANPKLAQLLISLFVVDAIVSAVVSRLPVHGKLRLVLDAAIVAIVCAPVIWWRMQVRMGELASAEAIKFRSLLDAAPEGVIGVGEDGRIRFANAESQRLFQYAEADLVGQSIELLMPDRFAGPHVRTRTKYVADPNKRSMGSGLEVTARRRDGSEFPADISLNHIRTSNGTLVISMIRDVTPQRQNRDALLEANRKLQVGLAEKMRHVEEMRQLRQMAEDLQACHCEQELYACVAISTARLFPGSSGALYIIGAAGDLLEATNWGPEPFRLAACTGPSCSPMLRGGRSSDAPDAKANPTAEHVSSDGLLASSDRDRTYHCAPMLSRGEPIGALHLAGRRLTDMAGMPVDPHLEILQTIADQVGLSIANLRLREALRLQSICDPLTTLYNRRFMDEWLACELPRSSRSHRPTSLLMFDLDHFKRFNDRYGHECGDLVLQEVAAVLRGAVRQSDIACRIGGEEFVLLLPETKLADALCIAEKLRGLIAAHAFAYQEQPIGRITASIGVAESPRHGNSPALLLRAADLALYQAKSAGRDRIAAAADSMHGEVPEILRVPIHG